MSDDESARPASTNTPSPEPTTPGSTATTTATVTPEAPVPGAGGPESATSRSDGPGAAQPRADAPEAAASPAGAIAADDAVPETGAPATTVPGPAAAPPGAAQTAGRLVAFLKEHAVTIVLAVLLVGAIVWGALGMVSTNTWESRASSLSADLAETEEAVAEAEATIDELETAKDRAETTATACVGAIDDVDAMLEVAAEVDEKTEVYVDGLSDFMAALNSGDLAGAETIGAEVDKLSGQIDDLNEQIEEHIEDYGDSAEGCHVDDPQDV